MLKIKSVIVGLFCLIATLLSACSKDMMAYDQKHMRTRSTMLLAETKHWNPLDSSRYWVFPFAAQPYYNNYINTTIPTYDEYKEHPEKWQRMHGSALNGWSRIVGIVPKGTKFRIIDITPANGGPKYWATIRFEDGPYNGESALYGNPREIAPELYR